MQTKIGVEIHNSGTMNDAILRMVASNNEGKVAVTQELISARCKCYFAEWPPISPTFNIISMNTNGVPTVDIYENDKPTISLTWKEIHELKDDLPSDLYTKGVHETERAIVEELEQKNLS